MCMSALTGMKIFHYLISGFICYALRIMTVGLRRCRVLYWSCLVSLILHQGILSVGVKGPLTYQRLSPIGAGQLWIVLLGKTYPAASSNLKLDFYSLLILDSCSLCYSVMLLQQARFSSPTLPRFSGEVSPENAFVRHTANISWFNQDGDNQVLIYRTARNLLLDCYLSSWPWFCVGQPMTSQWNSWSSGFAIVGSVELITMEIRLDSRQAL